MALRQAMRAYDVQSGGPEFIPALTARWMIFPVVLPESNRFAIACVADTLNLLFIMVYAIRVPASTQGTDFTPTNWDS